MNPRRRKLAVALVFFVARSAAPVSASHIVGAGRAWAGYLGGIL